MSRNYIRKMRERMDELQNLKERVMLLEKDRDYMLLMLKWLAGIVAGCVVFIVGAIIKAAFFP